MHLVPVRAKELRYAIELTATGELRDENGVPLEVPAEWSAEHLLLSALVRCSLTSLGYHARRGGIDVPSASGRARGLVTRRETDGRYAVVGTEAELSVELQPEPEPNALAELLATAERDCFIGSSLTAKPSYRWTVNGRTVGS
jgi:organic hydroperoxide reductase OsmC/OhrA